MPTKRCFPILQIRGMEKRNNVKAMIWWGQRTGHRVFFLPCQQYRVSRDRLGPVCCGNNKQISVIQNNKGWFLTFTSCPSQGSWGHLHWGSLHFSAFTKGKEKGARWIAHWLFHSRFIDERESRDYFWLQGEQGCACLPVYLERNVCWTALMITLNNPQSRFMKGSRTCWVCH